MRSELDALIEKVVREELSKKSCCSMIELYEAVNKVARIPISHLRYVLRELLMKKEVKIERAKKFAEWKVYKVR